MRYDKVLLLIPAYFQSPNESRRRVQIKAETFADELHASKFPHPDSRHQLINEYIRNETIPWRYNQVVGFVELVHTDGGFKAFYWWVDAHRTSPSMSRKRFKPHGKLTDVCSDPSSKTNEEIRDEIQRFFDRLPTLRDRFKGRFFDTRNASTLLEFVDFHTMCSNASKEANT